MHHSVVHEHQLKSHSKIRCRVVQTVRNSCREAPLKFMPMNNMRSAGLNTGSVLFRIAILFIMLYDLGSPGCSIAVSKQEKSVRPIQEITVYRCNGHGYCTVDKKCWQKRTSFEAAQLASPNLHPVRITELRDIGL